jgi:uncharacterized protein
MKNIKEDHLSPGWAVITGASGGLGTSFVLGCARRGYHLLLIDLPGKHLENLAGFIGRNFPVQTSFLEIDLTQPGFENKVMDKVRAEKMVVKMLINNAGMNQNDFFEDTNGQYMRKMVELNSIAGLVLTRALLPDLKANRESNVINVSSLGSFYPLPRKSCYTATKGFLRQFSQALRMEVLQYGVNVSILCPGPMTTNLGTYILHRQLTWFARQMKMHPDAVVEKTLRDALRGKEIIIPGRLNRVLKGFTTLIPGFIQKKLAVYSMKQLAKKETAPVKEIPQPVQKEVATRSA